MKYKYIAGLLIALGLSSGFAADVGDVNDDVSDASVHKFNYIDAYQALKAFEEGDAVEHITAALEDDDEGQRFDLNDIDNDHLRRAICNDFRRAVIGLTPTQFKKLLENETNKNFITQTSFGMSLGLGWMMNQLGTTYIPAYTGRFFSYKKMLESMATRVEAMGTDFAVNALKITVSEGVAVIDEDRNAFFGYMIYLPYAIQQIRTVASQAPATDDTIYKLINRSEREARAEEAELAKAAEDLPRQQAIKSGILDVSNWDSTGMGINYTMLAPHLKGKQNPLQDQIDAGNQLAHEVTPYIERLKASEAYSPEMLHNVQILAPVFSGTISEYEIHAISMLGLRISPATSLQYLETTEDEPTEAQTVEDWVKGLRTLILNKHADETRIAAAARAAEASKRRYAADIKMLIGTNERENTWHTNIPAGKSAKITANTLATWKKVVAYYKGKGCAFEEADLITLQSLKGDVQVRGKGKGLNENGNLLDRLADVMMARDALSAKPTDYPE